MDVPSRSDYYLMLIAHGISRMWSKKVFPLLNFVLRFGEKQTPKSQTPESIEQQSKKAASIWKARIMAASRR